MLGEQLYEILKYFKKSPIDIYPEFDHRLFELLDGEAVEQLVSSFPIAVELLLKKAWSQGEKIFPLFTNLDIPPMNPKDLDIMVHAGKLVALRAQVLRKSETFSFKFIQGYRCTKDKSMVLYAFNLPWKQKDERPPIMKECGSPEPDPSLSWYVETAYAVISDVPEYSGSKEVREIETVILGKPNVERLIPGDKAILYGTLLPILDERKSIASEKFFVFGVVKEEGSAEVSADEERLKEMVKDPWHEWRLLASFAPAIWGRWDDLKRSMLMSLLGGVKAEEGEMRFRDKIHSLIISGPGQGKSAIFSFVERIFPRTYLVSGSQSTSAGLVASVINEGGRWTLAVGALALASGGVVLIDEFDKISKEDMDKLLEAMEQGRVSVNKASIHAIITTDTTVIAVANPRGGKYDPRKTVEQNIGIKATLLSRFDIILLLHEYVSADPRTQDLFNTMVSLTVLNRGSNRENPKHLYTSKEVGGLITRAKEMEPKLGDGAKRIIEEHYRRMLKEYQLRELKGGEVLPISITPRTLEAMKRIALARAKLWLKDEADEEDAMVAVWLVERLMKVIGTDPLTGELDPYGGLGVVKRRSVALIEDKVRAYVLKRLAEMERGDVITVNALVKGAIRYLGEIRSAGLMEKDVRKMVGDIIDELDGIVKSGTSIKKIGSTPKPLVEEEFDVPASPIERMLKEMERPSEFHLLEGEPVFDNECPFREVRKYSGKYYVYCHLRATPIFSFEVMKGLCNKEKCPFYKEFMRRAGRDAQRIIAEFKEADQNV